MSDNNRIMMASDLINLLQDKIEKHGDLPMAVLDADTEWLLNFDIKFEESNDDSPDRLEISSCYTDHFNTTC